MLVYFGLSGLVYMLSVTRGDAFTLAPGFYIPRLTALCFGIFEATLSHGFYSYLRATNGSTLAARRAGSQHASSATSVSSVAITINVTGSLTLTP